MRKYDNPGQPNLASLRQPSPHEGYRTFPPPVPTASYNYAFTARSHDEIRQHRLSSQSPAAHPRCNSFVSYGPATTMQLMQLLPDTNRSFSATNGVARPYLRYNRHRPTPKRIRHDEIRQTLFRPQSPSIQHPLYTCVSYGPATTTRQIRHSSDTNRVFSAMKVSNVSTPTHSTSPLLTTTKSANHVPPPKSPLVELLGPIRASYGSGTNGTPLRYESLFRSYKPSPMPYLAWHRPPPKIPGTPNGQSCYDLRTSRKRLSPSRSKRRSRGISRIPDGYLSGSLWWRAGHPCQGKPGPVSGC